MKTDPRKRISGQHRGLNGLMVLALTLAAVGAFAANGERKMPQGISDEEWDRLARPSAFQEIPEFLSPDAMSGLRQDILEAIRADFAERGRIQVQSDRYLDYDEIRNVIYSNARTRIRFDKYLLEADQVLVHVPLQEIQAKGNVVLQAWRDPAMTLKEQEIHCEAMVFNYKHFEGAAYEVRGQHNILFFKTLRKEGELPSFNIVSRDKALLRDVEFTTCDFPDPQYALRTRDAILVFDDRLFVQRATLYVRHIPVFWIPAYTKSLHEQFPWHITFGQSSRLGTYVNVHYNYWHYRYEPSFEDEDEMELRDRGHATTLLSLMSDRGVGAGLNYGYGFDFEKHTGELRLFGLPSDSERNVPGDDNDSRWLAYAQHRSELRNDLMLHLGVDYMSDPEVYYDLVDPHTEEDRGRVPERRARAALTYWKDDYVARALLEVKERVTRDRITNTLSPFDDDNDYETFPEDRIFDFDRRFDDDEEGLPAERYGIVSARLPHLTFGTSHIRIGGNSPLLYTLDVNAFNNLDKGLNFNSTNDDSFVLGFDLYQQLSYLFKFSERYTLLAQIGAGLGVMERLDDTYNWEEDDFLMSTPEGLEVLRPDIEFVDDSTFFVTTANKDVSLSDTSSGFAYADAKLRFQGRFTDSLTGNVYYILREGTDDSLSEFYESIGNKTARTDLYDYRIRKHWIEGDLLHSLVYPNIQTSIRVGRNLESNSDIYANEKIQYAGLNSRYQNERRTFMINGYVRYDQFQVRDPNDVNEYQRDSITFGGQFAYAPIHRRWWVSADAYYWKALNDDPLQKEAEDRFDLDDLFDDDDDTPFTIENDDNINVDVWIGKKFGEKWTVELGAEYDEYYDGLRRARAILTRDLHNALAKVEFRYRKRPWRDSDVEYDVQFSLDFKLPGPMDTVLAPRARSLMDQQRRIVIDEGVL